MAHEPLTAQRLRELLHYDGMTGIFTWKVRTSNRVNVGAVAGSPHIAGYFGIGVDGKPYLAHRLAWLYVHGRWPAVWVDHINGVKSDNRIANLREATPSENIQNMSRAWNHSKSGILGVSPAKNGKWNAVLHLNQRKVYSSLHNNIEDARKAYLNAKARLHPFAPTKETQ